MDLWRKRLSLILSTISLILLVVVVSELIIYLRLFTPTVSQKTVSISRSPDQAKAEAEKKFPWLPTKLMSYPTQTEERMFVILGTLEEKGGETWLIRPEGGETLQVFITPQTRFYLRQPYISEGKFVGEKSIEINRENFIKNEVVMVEWQVPGIKDEKEIIGEEGQIKPEYRQIKSLTISKRER